MPYALIPEGFTLKKVTKAQEDAVKDYRRHDDVKTFLGNETTPILVGGAAIAALTPAILALFLKLLDEQNIPINDAQKAALKAGLLAVGPAGWALLAVDKVRKEGLPDLPDLPDLTKYLKVI